MTTLKGIPASPGAAVAQARVLFTVSLDIPEEKSATKAPEAELERFRAASAASAEELKKIREVAEKRLNREEAEIFTAHLMMLDDPALTDAVAARVTEGGLTAESAAAASIRELAAQFDAMEDEYFRERAADIRDVGRRLLKNLICSPAGPAAACRGIVAAEELLPSDAALLDPALVAGIATEKGGPTSHASILSRALGIPCVVGVAGLLEKIADGDEVALDGENGLVVIRPDEKTKRDLLSRSADKEIKREIAWKRKDEPAITADGRRIMVMANAGTVDDIEAGMRNGADGIGLFRTEFYFLNRKTMPTEQEQAAVYAEAVRAARGMPVAIRLLDIGGDKPAEYLKIAKEDNPFLGLRSIRLLLERKDVLRSQIRAILKASREGNASILVPMVTEPDELRAVRIEVNSCREELAREGVEAADVPLGIMVEVPAAALWAPEFAAEADYFSIGTNDLTQYTLAADRGNAAVAHLYRPDHPAVMLLIRTAANAARAAGIKTGVCGEAASSFVAIPRLLELGVDSLSVAPGLLPEVKEFIRNMK